MYEMPTTCTAAYFDHSGLYAFGRQPEAILVGCNTTCGSAKSEPLISALDTFGGAYQHAVAAANLWRLEIRQRDASADHVLITSAERALRQSAVAIDRFFFDACSGRLPQTTLYDNAIWTQPRTVLDQREPRGTRNHPYWLGKHPVRWESTKPSASRQRLPSQTIGAH